MVNLVGRVAGLALALGAWTVNLTIYPAVLGYAYLTAPGAARWHELMEELGEEDG